MPNRKDPFTKEMLLHTHPTAEKDPDSLSSAIADWFTLGLSTGFCKSEWAQEASERSSTGYKLAPDGSSLAITPNNMALFGLHRAHLCTGADITTGIATGIPHETSITWRFQKNLDNGQTLYFCRNNAQPHLCPSRASVNLLQRAQRLGIAADSPLAVYRETKGRLKGNVRFITDTQIKKYMHQAAKVIYGITKKEKLTKWTSHSLWVGACTTLHAGGMQPMTIKFRLRWRSNSYVDYLRHTPTISAQQVEAQNKA